MTKPVAAPGFRYLWRKHQMVREMAPLLAFRAIVVPRHPLLAGVSWQSFWQSLLAALCRMRYIADVRRDSRAALWRGSTGLPAAPRRVFYGVAP